MGTTQRFVLLIVLFLAGSGYMLSPLLKPLTGQLANTADGCALAAGYNPEANSIFNQLITAEPAFGRCLDQYAGGRFGLILPYFATAALVVLSLALYVLLPYWKVRASRAVPLAEIDVDGSIRTELAQLAARSGLRRPPRFVVDPAAFRANAVVFGRWGRYTVRLDSGLVALFGKEPTAFRATLLHEFAHIRNGDVDITYLTVAIWRVFAIGVLLPYTALAGWHLVALAFRGDLPSYMSSSPATMVRTLILAAFLVALTYLAMADVLRYREICADLEAIDNDADPAYWTRHVAAMHDERNRFPVVAQLIRSAFRTHPDWPERVAATHDTGSLLVVRAMPMFLSGAAAGIIGYFLSFQAANQLSSDASGGPWGRWPATALVIAVAGVAVWRSVIGSVRGDRPASSGLRAGLWLGAGQLCADVVLSQSLGVRWLPPLPHAPLLILLVLVPAAVLWWTAACAALWAGLRSFPSRIAAAALTLSVSGAALAWWFGWWQVIGRAFAGGGSVSASEVLAVVYSDMPPSTTMQVVAALTVPVLSLSFQEWSVWLTGALWIVPLVALTHRARATGTHGLSVGVVLGLLGGMAAGVGLTVATSTTHHALWDDGQPALQAITLETAWFFAILFCSAVGAAVAASIASRGNAATAMAAGGIAMTVGCFVLFLLTLANGCVSPLTTADSTCMRITATDGYFLDLFFPQLLGVAGMSTLVIALVGAIVARLSPGRQQGVAHQNPHSAPGGVTIRRPGRGFVRVAGTALTCIALVTACAVGYSVSVGQEWSDADSPSAEDHDLTFSGLFQAPVSTELLDAQVWAWGVYGGFDLLASYEQALGDLLHSVGSDGSVDVPAMRQACTSLVRFPFHAGTYFPIPDPGLQSEWLAALDGSRGAARKCLAGLDRKRGDTLSAAFQELLSAPNPVACIAVRVEERTTRAQQRRGMLPNAAGTPVGKSQACAPA